MAIEEKSVTVGMPKMAGFELTPPEVLEPVGQDVAKMAVPLSAVVASAVEEQVDRFVASLLTEDVQSEGFRAKLDSAFALGR